MPKFGEFLIGKGDRTKKLPTMDQGQQQFFNSLLAQLMGMQGQGGGFGQSMGLLQDYLNPESNVYKNFEAPYMQQFEQQTIPQLAERFAGLGGGMGAGGMASSGFGQALGAAGANLQTNLASMKSQLQRQSINDLLQQYMGMGQMALGKDPFAYQYQPGGMGFLPSMAIAGAQGFGEMAGKTAFPGA